MPTNGILTPVEYRSHFQVYALKRAERLFHFRKPFVAANSILCRQHFFWLACANNVYTVELFLAPYAFFVHFPCDFAVANSRYYMFFHFVPLDYLAVFAS